MENLKPSVPFLEINNISEKIAHGVDVDMNLTRSRRHLCCTEHQIIIIIFPLALQGAFQFSQSSPQVGVFKFSM